MPPVADLDKFCEELYSIPTVREAFNTWRAAVKARELAEQFEATAQDTYYRTLDRIFQTMGVV